MKSILQTNNILMFFSKCLKRKKKNFVLTILFLVLANSVGAQTTTNRFNDGYISVFRNTSGATLGSTGTAIVIDEFSPTTTGQTTANFSVALPNSASAGSTGIVAGATTSSNGAISRSENGRYLLVPGWSTNTSISGNTTAIGAANSTYIYCAVRPFNGAGSLSAGITGASNWFSAANDYRGVTSDDGTNYWMSGASLGLRTTANGTVLTTVSTTSTNIRAINIINGQLYYSTGSGTQGIYQVGIGKPTSSTTSANLTTSTGAYGFAISPDFLTLYTNSATGVISRFTFSGSYSAGTYSGGAWSSASSGFTLASATGLTVDWSNYSFSTSSNGAVIYASNTVAGTSVLVKANDNGTAAMTTVTIAYVSGNNIFKQIAFSPIKQTVSLGTASPLVGAIATGLTDVKLFAFSLSADEGNSTLKKLIVSQNGTASIGNGNSISNFRLIEDLDNNGIASPGEISASLATGIVLSGKINFSVAVNTSNYIQQGNTRNYIILGDTSSTGSGTFIPNIVSNNTINGVAYTSNLVNAGGSLVTMGTNVPTGNALTITSAVTWDGFAWTNTIGPDSTIEAIIDGVYSGAAFDAKKLTVNSAKSLTVTTGTMTVQNEVINNGTFVVNNNANLVQVNNSVNTGAISVNRNSSPLLRMDYTLWSSPVVNQNLAAFSPLTSQLPSRFYFYDSAADLYSNIGNPTGVNFEPGAGCLIRMPNTADALTPTAFAGIFTGVPNNGDVPYTLATTGNGFNLVGNPYPSPITMSTFVSDNSTKITGTLYFWRKTNGVGTAYCTWTGGVFVTNNNLQSVNPSGIIQTGQGFFVKASAPGSVTFKNGQRVANTVGQFFKTKQVATADRIWLNATNTAGDFSQMALNYTTGATQGVDAFDGKYINDSSFALTSNVNNQEYTIEGRPAFDATDVVSLNFKTSVAGDYTIAIDHADGLLANGQDVYLVDNKTGDETNLKTSSYGFKAASGADNARFSLKYQRTLKVGAPVFNENSITVYKNNGVVYVNSRENIINNIKVYDVQGRLIAEQNDVKATTATINLKTIHQVLIVKIMSQDNKLVSKKVAN